MDYKPHVCKRTGVKIKVSNERSKKEPTRFIDSHSEGNRSAHHLKMILN